MNSYLNDRKAVDRLKKEYLQHNNLIIGFDFDNTIFDYHKQGLDIQSVVELLKKCSDLGFTMCMFSLSCQEGKGSLKAVHCVKKLGIRVDHINSSPVMLKQDSNWPSKPFFSILLDDRAGLSAAYKILSRTLKELKL